MPYKNIEDKRAQQRRKSAQITALVGAAKNMPCMDCGGSFPLVCMDFDHRDSSTKIAAVARLAGRGMPQALEEIKKCDVVCSNCHRIRTAKRRRG